MENLSKLLSSKGVRPTYQRLKIIKYLKENRIHPTAEKIYQAILKEIPSISRTTVYNTLKMLVEHGLLVALSISGTEAHFDFETGLHHHFFCESCGKLFDIDISCSICEKKDIDGHIIKQLHGYFKGICRNCK
jgi:Fe2+ or Zn2+ uptake regulation protein